MHEIPRRSFVWRACALGASLLASRYGAARERDDEAPAPSLAQMLRHPLLADSLYRLAVSKAYAADGAAGANREEYRWIEEQRQGAEWIVRGSARGNPDWIALGWRELDWGLAHQAADGGYASRDPFHSTSFFVEALARACLIDPAGSTPARVRGLARGAAWLMSPAAEAAGIGHNQPYTHRRYILAAAFGQAAQVSGEQRFRERAARWASEGLGLQQPDGTNPEKGGFDAGYQMVGVLMALRYLPVCEDPRLRARLRAMIRKAVAPELARQRPDGSIDPAGSTRIELEHTRNGQTKDVPYGEIVQALVYGAQAVPKSAWLAPARRMAISQRWLKT